MPTPPASATTLLFSIRSLTPRRHRTTFPVTLAGSSVSAWQSSASSAVAGASAASSASMRVVAAGSASIDEPPVRARSSPGASVIVAVALKARELDAAATEVSHGTEAGEPTVSAPGPALPAELATKTPASDAPRKAISSEPITVEVSDPME